MTQIQKRSRGRPPAESAVSHDAILDAVYHILQHKTVRELTMEEVARHAKVGKPTLYRWWPSKAALVMDMFEERVMGTLAAPDAKSAEEAFRIQATQLIRLFTGFFGKVAADIISEGQSDPTVLNEFRERYMLKRRAFTREWIARARASGEFRQEVDPELLMDMVYGPIYFRLLVRHQPLDARFGEQLLGHVMTFLKS